MDSGVRVRVAGFATQVDTVLLVQHQKQQRRYWLLPGGGVEAGETLADAVRREVEEETGYAVDVGRLLLICEAIEPGGRHIINLVFAAVLTGGSLRPSPDRVVCDARWVPRSEMLTLELRPPVAPTLDECWSERFEGPVRVLGNVWKRESGDVSDVARHAPARRK